MAIAEDRKLPTEQTEIGYPSVFALLSKDSWVPVFYHVVKGVSDEGPPKSFGVRG